MEQNEQLTMEEREQIRVQAQEFLAEGMWERGDFAIRECECATLRRLFGTCRCGADEHNELVM